MTRPEDRDLPPDCRDVRTSLLEADRGSLSDFADDELGRHLATCGSCRLAAREVLDGQTTIDDWLRARVAARSVDRVLERVHAEIGEEAPQPAVGAPSLAMGRPRRVILSLALAAALAAVALWTAGDSRRTATNDAVPVARPASAPVGDEIAPANEGITVSANRRFALLETRRPTISVVWFY